MAEHALTTWESQDLRDRILERLLDAEGDWVSGAELSAITGVSRTAVWKHIQTLEELGFTVEAVRHRGYRLTHVPDIVLEPLLRRRLPAGCALGRRVLYAPVIGSTNATLAHLAQSPALPHGTVLAAGTQTGGRGRRGRSWFSPDTGLWFSVLIRRQIPLSRAAEITLLASVAVRRAILRQTDAPVQIKWPNDLLMDERKVCGILAELRADGEEVQHVVLGIGINANVPHEAFPDELANIATSILAASGRPVHRTQLGADVLRELEPMVEALAMGGAGFAAVIDEWRSACHTLGRDIRVQTPGGLVEGFAIDISPDGRLLVRTHTGERLSIPSGEVLF